MRTSAETIPVARGRAIDTGRSLVIAAALAATLSAGFAAGRLTVPEGGRTGAPTIDAPQPVTPKLASRPPHHDGAVKSGSSAS